MKKAVMYNMASKKHKKYYVHTDITEEQKSENSEEKVTTARKSSSKRP